MYTIRQVAELTGFSPDTLRYYEKIGLLESPERRPGGIRAYSDDNVKRLVSIHCLKKTGLSLDELKAFLQDGRCLHTPPSTWSAEETEMTANRERLLADHLAGMERQRRELDAIIEETKTKLAYYRHKLQERNQWVEKEIVR
ncbi:MAG: MerR family transcriptional regulator [Paenibacillaceae bacterium]|nr:MerR family transcriptional regulator [Paenibacillaceae bacterium]